LDSAGAADGQIGTERMTFRWPAARRPGGRAEGPEFRHA